MTTTIVPALGQGAVMNQATSYDAIAARRFWSPGRQEGVLSAGSFEVTQRGAGANLSVDIAASTGDGALVQGDAVTAQGLYHVPPHTAVINEAITTAHASLPRIDQVVLEIKDHTHDASGSNLAQVRVVAGTATSGATLTNRTGAAALPSSAILLADVLVAATDTSISNSEIRDRRPWARGAYCQIIRNANAAAGNDYTLATASGQITLIDGTNLAPRIKCSGLPLRMTFTGVWSDDEAGLVSAFLAPQIDSLGINGMANLGASASGTNMHTQQLTGGGNKFLICYSWTTIPAAGSHIVAPAWAETGASSTLTMFCRATIPIIWTVEEILRPSAANNATTTG